MIQFGCHGSTWELDYEKETDYLEDILDVIQESGFLAIDAQISLLGKFKHDPENLKAELEKRNLQLAALTLPFTWGQEKETEKERELADYYIHFLSKFPDAKMNIAPRVGASRSNLYQRQKEIVSCANALAKRAHEKGVIATFHPSSPPTSYFRVKEDYDALFNLLDSRYIGYTPDAGHIAFGGMNPVEIFEQAMPLIKHVHFKDCAYPENWRKMGTGDIDFKKIVQMLTESGYNGWIMVEEETKESEANPREAILDISSYVENNLKPIIRKEV